MVRRVHQARRTARTFAIVVVSFGTLAAAAGAATLSVAVTPASIHKRDNYEITVRGSYSKSELTGKAYLISVIQYSSAPCWRTAQLEATNATVSLQFYLAPNIHSQKVGIFLTKPRFSRSDGFKALILGTRRVCSYLYPNFVSGKQDTTAPIAIASAKYTVLKKK